MTTIDRMGRAASVAALTLIIAGCSGSEGAERAGTGGSNASERLDVCALVPSADVATIVGTAVTKTQSDFSEQTYSKPATYTSSCMYLGDRIVMLYVNYPRATSLSSGELASRVTEQLRSEVGKDPSTDEVFRTTQVRPVALSKAAAEYEMLGQTRLEVHTGSEVVTVLAASLDEARRVAELMLSRLD